MFIKYLVGIYLIVSTHVFPNTVTVWESNLLVGLMMHLQYELIEYSIPDAQRCRVVFSNNNINTNTNSLLLFSRLHNI